MMMGESPKEKCIMKGCNEVRYKDKYFCEKHWKGRRYKPSYKPDKWEEGQ